MRAFHVCLLVLSAASAMGNARLVHAQAGLRESFERLDRNENGYLEPQEITPLARPYLERILQDQRRRISLDEPVRIERLLDAARLYYAARNGVFGRNLQEISESNIKSFDPDDDQRLVPGFGLGYVKYPYTKADLDEADQTLRRYDRNRDGYIDRAEAAVSRWTHREPFDTDFNRDDRLSRMELCQRYARRRLLDDSADELWQKRRREEAERRANREVERRPGNDSRWWRDGGSRYWLSATILGRFDANRNGRLEREEADELGVPISRIDTDTDGLLSRDELQAYFGELQDQASGWIEGLPGWFFELDENRDRQVSMAEFASEWTEEKLREFTGLDTNQDGMLTSSEVIQARSAVGGTYRNDKAEVLPPRKTIISEIEVEDDYVIADLDVRLSITHTYVNQLDGYLTGPDGQRIELFTEVGESGDHFDGTVFDDQARQFITKSRAPFKGEFVPAGRLKQQPSLDHFNGKNVKGVWQLVIRGTRNERFGMLHGWELIVRPNEDAPLASPAIGETPEEPSDGDR